MEHARDVLEDQDEAQFNRKEIAVWMRQNCDVPVDFEDWDGLDDQGIWVLVWTTYGIDMHGVIDAMRKGDA